MRRVSLFVSGSSLFLNLRLIMLRNAFLDRRKFLQWGALGGVLGAAGCSGGGDNPSEVTTPPVAGKGNRMLLKKSEEVGKAAADAAAAKRKKR
jgi:hypothetical protein